MRSPAWSCTITSTTGAGTIGSWKEQEQSRARSGQRILDHGATDEGAAKAHPSQRVATQPCCRADLRLLQHDEAERPASGSVSDAGQASESEQARTHLSLASGEARPVSFATASTPSISVSASSSSRCARPVRAALDGRLLVSGERLSAGYGSIDARRSALLRSAARGARPSPNPSDTATVPGPPDDEMSGGCTGGEGERRRGACKEGAAAVEDEEVGAPSPSARAAAVSGRGGDVRAGAAADVDAEGGEGSRAESGGRRDISDPRRNDARDPGWREVGERERRFLWLVKSGAQVRRRRRTDGVIEAAHATQEMREEVDGPGFVRLRSERSANAAGGMCNGARRDSNDT